MNFNNDLILLFPNDKDFKLFKNGIVLLKATNPRKILTLFDQYVSKYEEKILQKDETFFLENNYDELDRTENILNTMDILKNYWKNLTDQNKEKVWQYFILLVKLNRKSKE